MKKNHWIGASSLNISNSISDPGNSNLLLVERIIPDQIKKTDQFSQEKTKSDIRHSEPTNNPGNFSDPSSYLVVNDAPADPLYLDQWHFDLLGDIETIWEDYTGDGVKVGIYDTGIQIDHPDLVANYDASLQISINGEVHNPDYLSNYYIYVGSPSPEILPKNHFKGSKAKTNEYFANIDDPIDPGSASGMLTFVHRHGTPVAGLIAAAKNEVGTVGVAYGVKFAGVSIFSNFNPHSPFMGDEPEDNYLEGLSQVKNFDIVNNSWGLGYETWFDKDVFNNWMPAIDKFTSSQELGRNGLGTIIVQAVGNNNENSSGSIFNSTRSNISVAAYGHDVENGIEVNYKSNYSGYGSNILVTAPSSSEESEANFQLVTTDIDRFESETLGTTIVEEYREGYVENSIYTSISNGFGGTSGSAPIVSGVVALMLEANPELGWRDINSILAYSSTEIGSGVNGTSVPSEENVWFYNASENWNGGGVHYSEDYGFGAVNAFNAVRMAEAWDCFDVPPQTTSNEATLSQTIVSSPNLPDDSSGLDIEVDFLGNNFEIESLELAVELTHENLPDLSIELISPQNTVSRIFNLPENLLHGYGDRADNGWNWTFSAFGFMGENAIGTWIIRITDEVSGNTGSLQRLTLSLFGKDDSDPETNLNNNIYHYTDEVFQALSNEPSRLNLTDPDGGTDWLNMAAMAGDLAVRLDNETTSTADGQNFMRLAAGADIENIVTGDGDDTITGNGLNNEIRGMRGNDALLGGDGDDLLLGGSGTDIYDGGNGNDTVSFEDAKEGILADLMGTVSNTGAASGETFSDIEGLIGTGFVDFLYGDTQSNQLVGGNATDRLYGRAGNDILNGEAGTDAIYGNSGADTMTGELGNDRFIYFQLSDSKVGTGNRDIITDFDDSGSDRMEISRFDADTGTGGNQAFNFVGTASFSNTAGELRFEQNVNYGWTIVQGDVNGDGIADFEIELTGLLTLNAADFLL